MSIPKKIALIGNPNTGKTSLFNLLTGLNQQVGNYPGITVDKKSGVLNFSNGETATLIDLPGTYSLNPSSLDEDVAVKVLSDSTNENYPDVVVVVVDVENIKRNLFLYTQIKDLGIPTILAINMQDQMKKKGISVNIPKLETELKTKIALISSKKNIGIDTLKSLIFDYKTLETSPCFIPFKSVLTKATAVDLKKKKQIETVQRYQFITKALEKTYFQDLKTATDLRIRLDAILTHKIFGYLIFFVILFLVFQALFSGSEIPMDFIDNTFANFAELARTYLPKGIFTNLLVEGIIPGIGGVVIFIPQIAFLFLFTSFLEESGYMSRVVFLMDKIMRKFGLSGKSIVPLISGTACSIPAIMAARNIENWKERLITILITPFTTCSARLPVYAIIISLIIPAESSFLSFNTQGLVLMALYLLGFFTAIFSAFILDRFLKISSNSYFVIEMPNYKLPMFKNVAFNVIEKTKAFVFEAGKIILAISILLWVLASYGPGDKINNASETVQQNNPNYNESEMQTEIASYKLEHSYIGVMGKFIEPVIKPLGYDWKIGVAVITSFAAREVFIGTLATIYSVGNEEESTIKDRMRNEVFSDTKKPVYSFATGVSILLFYAFAMQCMSTIAIVKRETNGWKWPLIQMVAMTAIAYITAFIAYQTLS